MVRLRLSVKEVSVKKEALAVAAEVETELRKGLVPQSKDEPFTTFLKLGLIPINLISVRTQELDTKIL